MKNNINSISIVIPVFNEENNILNLLDELKLNLENKINYEILIIDDGSTDKTVQNIKKKINYFKNLKLIIHRENYGQSMSLLTGVKNARYKFIVTLDGDGQNDPSDILNLTQKYNPLSSFFLVIGNRKKRNDKFTRRFASRVAYFARKIILKDKTPDTGCALKVFKKTDFLMLPFFNHIHRFFPIFFSSMGGEVLSVNVNHRERSSGISKYSNYQRALEGIYDLIGVIWLRKRIYSSILIKKNYRSKKK